MVKKQNEKTKGYDGKMKPGVSGINFRRAQNLFEEYEKMLRIRNELDKKFDDILLLSGNVIMEAMNWVSTRNVHPHIKGWMDEAIESKKQELLNLGVELDNKESINTPK
jgi:5'-3' exonuclease